MNSRPMDPHPRLWPACRRGSVVAEQHLSLGCPSAASSSTVTLRSRKKALLISISQTEGYAELKAAHRDAYSMRDLLIDLYEYTSDEITILLDDGIPGHVQPTQRNILLAIGELVKDVKEGDWLFFHYCGHSTQVDNPRSNSEEDGKDECLVPMDGEEMKIVDNALHAALVAPLPAGAHLVAILDTCHSGSLLDLKHYRCNRVPVPWIYKGKRNSEEIRNRVVRSGAQLLTLSEMQTHKVPASTRFRSRHNTISVMCDPQDPAASPPPTVTTRRRSRTGSGVLARLRTVSSRKRTMSHPPAPPPAPPPADKENVNIKDGPVLPALSRLWILSEETGDDHLCESPVGRFPCNGWCRNLDGQGYSTIHDQDEDEVKADVISLASCKDSQQAWDDENGQSMTSLLVAILRENPNRTLKDVLVCISHATYSMAVERHGKAKEFKQRQKRYIDKVNKELARLEHLEKNGSTTSLVLPGPTPFSFLATSRTMLPPRKRPFLPKRVASQIKWFRDKLKEVKATAGDMNNFQNPELASPRPLDLERPWRM
ncbi:caspase domain-containing protein [Mycena galericulata]|nr:caspase domain-containing protein [Mycena galericulata]